MAGKIFEVIKQNIHFSNNEEFNESTHPAPKLNKMCPVYDNLVSKFRNLSTPEQRIASDEKLLWHEGRSGWIQYIPRNAPGMESRHICSANPNVVLKGT